MKYYAICDVVNDYEFELRTEMFYELGAWEKYTHPIFKEEIDALRECNEINKNIEKQFKCVVVEIEV